MGPEPKPWPLANSSSKEWRSEYQVALEQLAHHYFALRDVGILTDGLMTLTVVDENTKAAIIRQNR
jgi:hypothetical protein